MQKCCFIMFIFLVLVFSAAGVKAGADKVIVVPESKSMQDEGRPAENSSCRAWIDWTEQKVRAWGRGEVSRPGGAHHVPYYTTAIAGQQAYRRLLAAAKSVQLTPTSTVGEALSQDISMLADFEDMLKNADTVKKEFISTGPVEVLLEFPTTGSFSEMVLPGSVTHLEKIEASQAESGGKGSEYTGLVVDARGLAIEPAMCFQIVDESGREVYGPAYVSRENAVTRGMCQYVPDVKEVEKNPRTGGNPLLVKGIRLHEPGSSSIVISNTDASRLKSSAEHLEFLRRCRVVIVVNSAGESGRE